MAEPVLEGGCFCGAVRFAVTPPSKWCAHCHCSMCRRSHGAGTVTWVGVERSHFRFTRGEEHLVWFASSPPARRGFCGTCGTTFLFESQRWPDEVHVTLANFDGPIDREPSGHAYPDDHVHWLPIRGGPGSEGPRNNG